MRLSTVALGGGRAAGWLGPDAERQWLRWYRTDVVATPVEVLEHRRFDLGRAPLAGGVAGCGVASDLGRLEATRGKHELVGSLVDLDLDVQGLMAIGPADDDRGTRSGFAALTGLADDLGLAERSMGMTGDLEIAVGEGATMIRVGSALFGPRPPRTAS